MKGLSETMVIIITVVVILIVALVLLAIFSQTTDPLAKKIKCQGLCAAGQPACQFGNIQKGQPVPGWDTADSAGCVAAGVPCLCQ